MRLPHIATIAFTVGGSPGLWIACSSPGGDVADAGDATTDSRLDAADATIKDGGVSDAVDGNRSCISGMIAWWKGDNNTTDTLGVIPLWLVGNTLDASGTIAYRPAEVGNGFYFDLDGGWTGVGHLEGDASTVLDGLPALTIEGWIAGPPGGYPGGLIIASYGSDQDGSTSSGFALRLDMTDAGITNGIELRINTVTTQLSPLSHDWSGLAHLAVTYHPSAGAVFYINGSKRLPAVSHMGPIGDAPAVKVGGLNPFSGIIDELSIYNVDLTAQQIQDIVAAGPKGKCP